ncbi:hypothetical protein C8F04DRAFT_1264958 [Mycena alexandri]|uniref:F-box domain-containing protein n=1 Tax=Mycena alexandri TaxID=1745969 RepID=A0AAD6SPM5_9AGAR|nr:hypothetical protein C8F04DRAFT_1264958 [Mycena alexandri]
MTYRSFDPSFTPHSSSPPLRMAVLLQTEIWALLKRSPSTLGRITQVSRSRHNLATTIPRLWTALYITESTDVDLLRVWLRRGNTLPLSIEINFRRAVNDLSLASYDFTAREMEHYTSLMEALRPFSEQWRSFTVFAPFYLVFLLKQNFNSSLPTPALTHISIDLVGSPGLYDRGWTGGGPETNSVFQHAPPVLAIRTSGYPHSWANFPFHSLTAITPGQFLHQNTLGWNVFAGAASHSPNLVSIAFVGEIPSPISAHNTGDSLLVLDLPSLTSLSVTHLNSGHLHHLLHHLKAPDLRSLALSLADEDDDFVPFLQAFPLHFPRIATLALEMLTMNEVAQVSLAGFFAPLARLTTLRLNFDSIPIAIWHALITPAGDTDFLPRLCEVDFVDVPLHSLQELAALRVRAGHRIEVISLHYSSYFYSGSIHYPPSSTTWLEDNTKSLFLSEGRRSISIWM